MPWKVIQVVNLKGPMVDERVAKGLLSVIDEAERLANIPPAGCGMVQLNSLVGMLDCPG